MKKTVLKILSVIACLALAFVLLNMPANAEGKARTFNVVYDPVAGIWAYQIDDGAWLGGVNLLGNDFKDGDILSVSASDDTSAPRIEIYLNTKPSQVVVVRKADCIVYAPGVDSFYTIDATGIVNGNVKNAVCYSGSVMQINGDCDEFNPVYEDISVEVYPVFAVTGKVGKATVRYTKSYPSAGTIYSIPAGKFKSSSIGCVWLVDGEYSTTAPSATPAKTPAKTPSKGQYDSVPKTGSAVGGGFALFALASLFAIGGVALRKTDKKEV